MASENQSVTVSSVTGTMRGIQLTPFPKIRPGNVAMYYPECNVLVPRSSDQNPIADRPTKTLINIAEPSTIAASIT